MADLFGDASLFAEFEKERAPSDAILMTKFDQNERETAPGRDGTNISANGGNSLSGKSDESSGDDDSEDSEDSDDYQNGQETLAGQFQNDGTFSSIKSELHQLKQKYQRLQRRCRMVDPNKYFGDDEGPAFQILFMNNDFARRNRSDLEEFLQKLVRKERSQRSSTYQHPPSLSLRPNAVILADDKLHTPQDKIRFVKSSTVIGCSQFYKEFTVDSMGWPLIDYNPSLTDGWDVPRYEQVFSDPLPQEESDDEEVSLICPKRKRPKASCWNCGGDHQINECTEPRNPAKISANRNQFMLEKAASNPNMNASRYHIEDDPKFVIYKPGKIGDQLRNALGLSSGQLPPFIYRMRELGYPPGHLENARIVSSGISMFDKHGKEVKTEDEHHDGEDGEVDCEEKNKCEYDLAKLIEYPGFNVDPPEGSIDEHRHFNAMPMMPHHTKSSMENHLSTPTSSAGVKRQHSDNASNSNKRRRAEPEDMDLDSSGEDPHISALDKRVDESRVLEERNVHVSHPLPTVQKSRTNRAHHPPPPPPPPPPLPTGPTPTPPLPPTSPSSPPPLPPGSPPSSPLESNPDQTPTFNPREIPLEKSSFMSPPRSAGYDCDPTKIATPFYSPKSDPPSPTRQCQPPPVGDSGSTVDEGGQASLGESSPFKTPRAPLKLPPPKAGSTPVSGAPPLPVETPPRAPPLPDGTPPPTPPTAGSDKRAPPPEAFNTPVGQSIRPLSNASSGGSLSMSFGTPVLDGSDSIKDKGLPDATKFKAGISDHLFFENLPESTGKYDEMRKIMAKVRNKLGKS